MKKGTVLLISILIIVFVLVVDQGTKRIASELLQGKPAIRYLNSFFVFIYAENTGAFLSLGRHWPAWAKVLFLQALPVILLGVVGFNVVRHSHYGVTPVIGLSLILGGGSGNLIDRILSNGSVIDFMNIGIGRIRTGIFNVADLAIMAGSAILIIGAVKADRAASKASDTGG